MPCDHTYSYASADTFAPRRCTQCGHVPCAHVWADAADGVPRCTTCGKRAHWSPSSLETAADCARKHGYKARGTQPDRENKYAGFGKRAHKIRENYLKFGTWTLEIANSPEGACVAAGMPFWPMPIPAGGNIIGVELEFEHDVMGVPASRKIDDVSLWRPGVYARAGDLKTIGRLGASHQKTPEVLAADPQRILYAYDIGEWLGLEVVGAQWTYCQRKPARAEAVEFEERRSITRERMGDTILPRARELVRLRLIPLEELPRNRDACRKYGEMCEYASHCLRDVDALDDLKHALYTLGDDDGYTSPVEETPMTESALPSLGDLARGAAQAEPVPATTVPANLPPMPGTPVPPPPAAVPTIALCPELETWVQQCAAQGQDVRATAEQAQRERNAAAVPAVPVASTPAVALVVQQAAPVVVPDPTIAAPDTQAAIAAAVDAVPTTPPAEAPPSTQAPKRGRGRPRKDPSAPQNESKAEGGLRAGDRLSLLCACAAAGMDSTQAEGYMELLEEGGA